MDVGNFVWNIEIIRIRSNKMENNDFDGAPSKSFFISTDGNEESTLILGDYGINAKIVKISQEERKRLEMKFGNLKKIRPSTTVTNSSLHNQSLETERWNIEENRLTKYSTKDERRDAINIQKLLGNDDDNSEKMMLSDNIIDDNNKTLLNSLNLSELDDRISCEDLEALTTSLADYFNNCTRGEEKLKNELNKYLGYVDTFKDDILKKEFPARLSLYSSKFNNISMENLQFNKILEPAVSLVCGSFQEADYYIDHRIRTLKENKLLDNNNINFLNLSVDNNLNKSFRNDDENKENVPLLMSKNNTNVNKPDNKKSLELAQNMLFKVVNQELSELSNSTFSSNPHIESNLKDDYTEKSEKNSASSDTEESVDADSKLFSDIAFKRKRANSYHNGAKKTEVKARNYLNNKLGVQTRRSALRNKIASISNKLRYRLQRGRKLNEQFEWLLKLINWNLCDPTLLNFSLNTKFRSVLLLSRLVNKTMMIIQKKDVKMIKRLSAASNVHFGGLNIRSDASEYRRAFRSYGYM